MMRLDLGKGPWGPGLGVGEKALTPLDTAWHRCCIQSAISASLSALSSRQGRSARMTWKAWGRSVVLDLRQPPHCSPLGQRRRVRRVEEAGVAQGSSWAGRGLKTWGCPRVWGAGGHQRVVQTPQLPRRRASPWSLWAEAGQRLGPDSASSGGSRGAAPG